MNNAWIRRGRFTGSTAPSDSDSDEGNLYRPYIYIGPYELLDTAAAVIATLRMGVTPLQSV